MTLGDLISQVELQTGSSIQDPLVLSKTITLMVPVGGTGEAQLDTVDVDGDVIVLEG